MDANVKGFGSNADFSAQVDATHRNIRAGLRPNEAGLYGSYRKTMLSGVCAANYADASPVWEMRWGQTQIIAIVRKLRIQAVVSTTAFGATSVDSSFSLYRAQGFTALDGTNGTYALFTKSKSGASSTRFSGSQFASDTTALRPAQGGIVITSTAALSGGTKTLDDNPIAACRNRIVASAAVQTAITPDPSCYLIDPAEAAVIPPVELDQNEGLVLTLDAIEDTGTWRLLVEVCWDEVNPDLYFG